MNSHVESLLLNREVCRYPAEPALSLRTQRTILRIALILLDSVLVLAAFRIAYWFRFDIQLTLAPEVVPLADFYPKLAFALFPTWILLFAFFRLYDFQYLLGGVAEYARIFHASTVGMMLVILTTFLIPEFVVSRLWVIAAWMGSLILVTLGRFFLRRLVYLLRERGYLLVPALIVGTNSEAQSLIDDLKVWRSSGIRIVGIVEGASDATVMHRSSFPVLGSLDDITEIIEKYGVEEIIVSITDISRDDLFRLSEEVSMIPGAYLRLSSGLYELLTTGVSVKCLGPVPLVSMNRVRLEPLEVFFKTLFETTLTLLALIFLAPLMIFIALTIKLDSKGPVFYRRKVLGVKGKEFDAFKFRTMYTESEEILRNRPDLADRLNEDHKLKDDPRVTPVGRWLRKYSLDELPQLFNVLLGQMSLVGPRMITAPEVKKYGRHRMNLLTVKPGITGLWQVSGRSDLSYEDRVRLDMYYIRYYSIWRDLQILFVQTIPAVLKGRGAY
jgi:exopolysaccharide biosynthesis polyprenyl glycosylphosphotransferase